MTNFRKTLTAGLAAATLGMGVAATSTPAAAWVHHPYWSWDIGAAAAGLALGAAATAAATSYYDYPYYGYPSCHIIHRPIFDYWGNIIRYRHVRVCY
jgi:hypothetical protein